MAKNGMRKTGKRRTRKTRGGVFAANAEPVLNGGLGYDQNIIGSGQIMGPANQGQIADAGAGMMGGSHHRRSNHSKRRGTKKSGTKRKGLKRRSYR